MATLLSVENVSKTFPGVKALQDVSFNVEAGAVHAVMGENGAGKSTLMLCIAGVQRPDPGGRMVFEGQPLDLHTTRDANRHGIAIVFQELNLAPNMSVAENIALGREPRLGGVFVNRTAMREEARRVLNRLGIALDPDIRLGALTIAQQQIVEICKSLVHQAPAADPGRTHVQPVRGGDVGAVPRDRRPQAGGGDDPLHLPPHEGGVRAVRRRHRPARRQARPDHAAGGHRPGRDPSA